MTKVKDKRKVFKFVGRTTKRIAFKNLRKGNRFYMEEPGSKHELVVADSGKFIFKVLSKPELTPKGVWSIEADIL